MAAGEYVSVSSQADTERADLAIERTELATQPPAEKEELAEIYVQRGLDPEVACTVASQLMNHDALAAHGRDELVITEEMRATLVAILAQPSYLPLAIFATSLICLGALGAIAAHAGGASPWVGSRRVAFWGALAMAATAGVGKLFGTTIS